MDLSRFRYQGADARDLKPADKTLGSPPRRVVKKARIDGGKGDKGSVTGGITGGVKSDMGSVTDQPPNLLPLPTLLQPGLRLVFVGFNPGIMSSEKGHYYAHPSNAFWKMMSKHVVKGSVTCYDDASLMASHGIGFTDLVARPSRGSDDLSRDEMAAGAHILLEQISTNKPDLMCIVGRGIWETVFRAVFKHQGVKKSDLPQFGLMPVKLAQSRVFVVPSTSGLVRDKREELWAVLGDLYDGNEGRRSEWTTTDDRLKAVKANDNDGSEAGSRTSNDRQRGTDEVQQEDTVEQGIEQEVKQEEKEHVNGELEKEEEDGSDDR